MASENNPPIAPNSDEFGEIHRNIWIAAWSGVGLFAVACLLVGVWFARSQHTKKVDAADLRVSRSITEANQWMMDDSLGNATTVELSLIEALSDENVSDPLEGQSILQLVRQHRNALEEQKRVAVAEQTAARMFDKARHLIKLQNGRDAIIILREYLAQAHATDKAEAQMILEELLVANSDSTVQEILVGMDETDFANAEKSGTLTDHRVTREEMIGIFNQTVKRNLPAGRKKREAIEADRKRLADEKAREEQRLAHERERKRKIKEAGIATNQLELEKFLHAGKFTNGIVEFQTQLLDEPNNDNVRFQLALTQFFGSVERLGQSLHRYGVKQSIEDDAFLRLPVPDNPNPEPISYAKLRRVLDDLIRDLDGVDATLARIQSDDVAVSLRLGLIRFDMDGDGNADQELKAILKTLHQQEFAFFQGNEALAVDFDRGDVSWLRIYCQLMSAVLDYWMAVDFEWEFDEFSEQVFGNPEVGNRDWLNEEGISIVEPRRLGQFRRRLILITELNHEMWKHIRAEKDNGLEWLPNSIQRSALFGRAETVLGFTVSDPLVDSWLALMTEAGAALKGERVLQAELWIPQVVPRLGDKKGLNLKNLLEDPPAVCSARIHTSLFILSLLPFPIPDKYFTEGVAFDHNLILELQKLIGYDPGDDF